MLLNVILVTLSAFLLFQAEPLCAKLLLPLFGGTSSVWTTCMLFFQTTLLLGYSYAYALTRCTRPRLQRGIHGILLGVTVLLLPIRAPFFSAAGAHSSAPIEVFTDLMRSIGVPCFMLSASFPILQEWARQEYPHSVPHRLYVGSNCGSLLGLISYPFIVEPLTSISAQVDTWSVGVGLCAVLAGCAAFRRMGVLEHARVGSVGGIPKARPVAGGYGPAMWFICSACGSILLLAFTNQLCQDIAPVPLLWVAPLALYLLSFIVAFSTPRLYSRAMCVTILTAAVFGLAISRTAGQACNAGVLVGIYAVVLLASCMICHCELVRLKPPAAGMAGFYLIIALGGVCGTAFVALLSPSVFDTYLELPIGLQLCYLIALLQRLRDSTWVIFHAGSARIATGFVVGSLALFGVAALALSTWPRPGDIRLRNFYGILKVVERAGPDPGEAVRMLLHGSTLHGLQYLDAMKQSHPTTYYGLSTGAGRVLGLAAGGRPRRVGAIGLGIGTIAAYGRKGDVFRFYEINPAVVDIALNRFFYLRNTQARVEIALGDARISLQQESPQNFDVLILDAFNSDAVPVHLLTKEAFQLYLRHLSTRGVIVVHVTNRYLHLIPVVLAVADHLGLPSRVVRSTGHVEDGSRSADYVVLAKDAEFLRWPGQDNPHESNFDYPHRFVAEWTDAHSSLFAAFWE